MVKFVIMSAECCRYKEMYADGKLIISGDCYHDKISVIIEGFLMACTVFGIEYTIEEIDFERCPNYCDDYLEDWDDIWEEDE